MKKITILGLQMIVLAGLSGSATAQTVTVTAKPLTDSDIALLRHDVQADKMQIITKTMQFTDAEAAAFWPVYRDYANEQQKLGDARYQLIKDYAQNYGQMTDDKAAELVGKADDLDKALLETRESYWPKFAKAISAKRAAKFYQVDKRLTLMIDLELSTEVPLLE
jgi:hypothetical protein